MTIVSRRPAKKMHQGGMVHPKKTHGFNYDYDYMPNKAPITQGLYIPKEVHNIINKMLLTYRDSSLRYCLRFKLNINIHIVSAKTSGAN